MLKDFPDLMTDKTVDWIDFTAIKIRLTAPMMLFPVLSIQQIYKQSQSLLHFKIDQLIQ